MQIRNRFSLAALLFFCLTFVLDASAATYYIAPSGSNSSPGTASSPWKTFTFALAKLKPGDHLLLRDGIYTRSDSGVIAVNCAVHSNGMPGNVITVAAENERRALLSSDGTARPISVHNCSYWSFKGIYARSTDSTDGGVGGLVGVYYSSHITIQRMLLLHPNACVNDHAIALYGGNGNNLVEENEIYDFHRHGIALQGGERFTTLRRNYVNSRQRADSSCSDPSIPQDRGDAAYIIYPGSYNILENNISEGQGAGYAIEAAADASENKFYGNVSLNDYIGLSAAARDPGGSDYYMPRNTAITDLLVVNPAGTGVYLRSNKNTQVRNISIFRPGGMGLAADLQNAPYDGDGQPSVFITNALVSTPNYSFYILNQFGFSCDYCSGQHIYNQGLFQFTGMNQFTSAPTNLGNCLAWIPSSSNLHTAGSGGADIGATILNRYEQGILTSQPLWNINNGEFPHGALVAGVNDIAGSSAYDVHRRLNINTNGCGFPATGTAPSTDTPPSTGTPPPSGTPLTLTAPTGLFSNCSSNGTTFTIGWNALPGAQSYYVRVDDVANNQNGLWYLGPEDFLLDDYRQTSFTAPVIPDQTYEWWVHGANSASGLSMSSSGTFSCNTQ
jgi:hypothetical protein